MAFDRPHLRVSFLFKIFNTAETAVTGLNLAPAIPSTGPWNPTLIPTPESLDALSQLYKTMVTTGPAQWAGYSGLHAVKVAPVDQQGRYTGEAVVRELATPIFGSSSQVLPQSSVAITLWSGETLGQANYGRMFLPHTRYQLPAAGESVASQADANNMAIVGRDFVRAVNTWATSTLATGIAVAIMGQQGKTKFVDFVRAGRVTDTQQRRRRSLDELPSTQAL